MLGLILAIGEILFDMFPEGRRLGGAPFNFAFHIHCLDGSLRFLSRIGNDAEGQAIEQFLKEQHFPRDDLQRDPSHPTGRVNVTLDAQGTPDFDIVSDVAYDFIRLTPSIERFVSQDCRLIYFGSLLQRTAQGARTVRQILQHRSPMTKCLFDVNLRPDAYNDEILVFSLRETDLLKLSEDELDVLAAMHGLIGNTADKVVGLMEQFDIEMVAVTRGAQGSSLFSNNARHDIQPDSNVAIKDTVGAGDAFAAMLAIGYLHGWPAARMLSLAGRLATAVCGIEGAVPTDTRFYAPFRQTLAEGDSDG
jgi:fructokinase